MEPIKVCELEAGKPKYQVPRFQIIADSSSEKTTLRINSTGSSASTPNATAPPELNTPSRFQMPLHTTAALGCSVCV